MIKKDYYQLLNISRTATVGEVKKAYRKMAVKYHPDKNPGNQEAEERFKELSEAYEVLSDPRRRQIYDQFGHDGLRGRGFGFHDPFDIFREFFGQGFGGSIFGDIFGFGGPRRTATQQGADIDYELEISLEEAAFGAEKNIKIDRQEPCSRCHGSGAEPGSSQSTCPRCGGSGRIQQTRRTVLGIFSSELVCSACHGEGVVISEPCRVCRGRRTVERRKEVTVKIPAGVEEGAVLRQRGGGEAGLRNGPPGDLNIYLRLTPHPIFKRSRDDIHCQVPISFTLAALGGEIKVPTLAGTAKLKIPTGAQSGQIFRLKGSGISHLHGSGRGDEHVQVLVEVPVRLNRKQRELLQQLEAGFSGKNHPWRQSFLEKFNKFLRRYDVGKSKK